MYKSLTIILFLFFPLSSLLSNWEGNNVINSDIQIKSKNSLEKNMKYNAKTLVPEIIAGDFDFGTILIDEVKSSNSKVEQGIRIENPGTDTLRITGVEYVEAPFSLPNASPTRGKIMFEEAILVPPNSTIRFGQQLRSEFLLEFAPKSERNEYGESLLTVNFISNANGPDPESTWRGVVIGSVIIINNVDFPPTRVNTVSDIKYFEMKNIPPHNENGESDPELGLDANVYLQDDKLNFPNNSEFKVDWNAGIKAYNSKDELLNTFSKDTNVILEPAGSEGANTITKLLVPVVYNPGIKTSLVYDSMVAKYKSIESNKEKTVGATATGKSYIPEIDISNVAFSGKVKQGEGPHPETMTLEIKNITDTLEWDVTIQDIYLDPNAPNSDQFVLSPDPSTMSMPFTLSKDSPPLTFEVSFLGDENADIGENIGRIIVESDAGDADALPTTENKWGVEASGNYVYDAPDTVDGGMMQGFVDNVFNINNLKNQKFEIYPNPVNDLLQIKTQEDLKFKSYKIIDLAGNVIFENKSLMKSKLEIDVSELNNGFYYIQLTTITNEIVREKFIKID